MSTQYRLVQSGKTASGGCSAGSMFVRAVAPRIIIFFLTTFLLSVFFPHPFSFKGLFIQNYLDCGMFG
jgi:hypothetical protein